MRLIFPVFCAIAATAIPARAADGEQPAHPPPRVSIEVDPVPYLLHGCSVHAGVVPLRHVRATLGVYGQRHVASDATDSDVRTRYAIVETIGGYLRADARGFGAGVVAIESNRELQNATIAGTIRGELVYLGAFVTWAWFPFDRIGLYLRPWADDAPDDGSLDGSTAKIGSMRCAAFSKCCRRAVRS